jgi:hypothetical protein
MRPTAIGIFVVPTDTAELRLWTAAGNKNPTTTPAAIAKKIHSVRKRSKHDSRIGTTSDGSMKFISPQSYPANVLVAHATLA